MVAIVFWISALQVYIAAETWWERNLLQKKSTISKKLHGPERDIHRKRTTMSYSLDPLFSWLNTCSNACVPTSNLNFTLPRDSMVKTMIPTSFVAWPKGANSPTITSVMYNQERRRRLCFLIPKAILPFPRWLIANKEDFTMSYKSQNSWGLYD